MSNMKVQYFEGNSYQIGYSIGCSVKDSLRDNISKIIKTAEKVYAVDLSQIKTDASLWLEKLPEPYQIEASGLADGSGCSMDLIMQWMFFDKFLDGGCTSFIIRNNGNIWVGRNNDYIAPKMWSYVNIISKENMIPVMLFGMGGDLFSGTGYNKEKLWLHYNWLPVWDKPDRKAYPPYVFLRLALESCRNLNELESMLKRIPRDGGMNLFAVDGKDNSCAVYECLCGSFIKRKINHNYGVGANHFNVTPVPAGFNHNFSNSHKRQKAAEDALCGMTDFTAKDLIDILADPDIEQDNGLYGTVYSNIACPAADEIYYACDDFPAASKSRWESISWNGEIKGLLND